MGSMERFVIVFGDYNFSNTCDNQLQRHLMRQTEVINNEKLQNFDAISRTYSGLEKMATTYIKRADIQPHKMHAEAALGQSYKLVNKILPRKISDKNNTAEHQQFYESFLEGLETSIIPSLENMLFA